ncbi:MAG: hypothetical protein KBA06_01970 [Saprospiraceae bacterium]|nr:hypothetical protein [Saprospiraceae bacterium]
MKSSRLFQLISIIIIFNSISIHNTWGAIADSIPEQIYKGFRLGVSNIREVKKSKSQLLFTCDLANTGKETLTSKDDDFEEKTIISFDNTLQDHGLSRFKEEIIHAILGANIKLKAGEVDLARDFFAKIKKDKLNTFETETTESNYNATHFDTKYCPDLIIDSIIVVKKKRKEITLLASVRNIGNGPTTWIGNGKQVEDNLSINGYLSGTPVISRGAYNLGSHFIDKMNIKDVKKIPHEYIDVGENIWVELLFDISSYSRYTPVLVLQIDPYLTIKECDRKNNEKFIIIK